jgi:hypothetical protein
MACRDVGLCRYFQETLLYAHTRDFSGKGTQPYTIHPSDITAAKARRRGRLSAGGLHDEQPAEGRRLSTIRRKRDLERNERTNRRASKSTAKLAASEAANLECAHLIADPSFDWIKPWKRDLKAR